MTSKVNALLTSLVIILVACVCAQSGWADDYDIYSRLDDDAGYQYHASPEDWRDINMYQLFTDRFYDGNTGNNFLRQSTTGNPWYNQYNSSAEDDRHLVQGGDWAGIKQKLGYLKGMGVNCIWISGVQLNEQGIDKKFTPYHAYHPANFYKAEPMFGTFAELKDLIDTAHGQGIYVVLDVVVNHMADLFKYTDCNCNYDGYCDYNCASMWWWDESVKFGAPFSSPDNFHNNGTIGDNDWDTYPKYVKGAFLGTEDLKTEDPYVQGELKNIFKHLIDATDCDGFRVDAIKHMEYDFIKQWADDIRKHAAFRGKSNFIQFGEYFSYDDGTQASYCKDNGYSFNSTLWFPMQMIMKNVFAYEQGTTQLQDKMNAMSQYGEAANNLVAFMDNHDVDRFALECGFSWEAKMRPALTFLYACLPVPCIFYGTEHGFNQGERRNGSPKLGQADFQRECMMDYGYQWGNANGDKFYASPLYNHIKALNEARAQYISLRRGSITHRWSEGGKGLFAISRVYGDEEAVVAFNTDWNGKTCTPDVSKPNGTQFINVLNPSETVTVSGGQLSFSVDGKGSKIFVAGQGNSVVETSCNTTTLTITYKPNGGPLASPVGNVQIGINHDGGQDQIDTAMTPSGGDWTYDYALTDASNEVTFWFYDEDTPPTYDNNDSINWNIDISGCGLTDIDLAWIGNNSHWPAIGDWDPGEGLWIDVESYPQDAVIEGQVAYTVDGGSTWESAALLANGQEGNNDKWHANLGAYPGGTTLRYAIEITGRNTNLWLNNGGVDYSNTVTAADTTVTWIGNTHHWPEDGAIEPGEDLWINIESGPAGAAVTGEVVYSSDGGSNWSAKGMSHNGILSGHDWWNVNLGGFSADTVIQYAVKIVDGDTTEHWDNNGGPNYTATVNPPASSVRWYGNTIQGGLSNRPVLGIGHVHTADTVRVEMDDMSSNAMYTVMMSTDLITWSNVATLTADAVTEFLELAEGGQSNGVPEFYRLRVDWVPGPTVYAGSEAVISIETWPIGGATAANIAVSSDTGVTWNAVAMHKTGTRGDNDIWSASLGSYPLGTVIQYAIEVIDGGSGSQWDNNDGNDFQFTILDPNQTDFEAPTTDHSPVDTVTSDATLDVTLSATDNQDPTPTIYYTTDGSTPTTGSATYSAAIHVTDQGSGVDMTIKFFARDATGNLSGITTVEVKVNENFGFGGDTPYSTNPTLGQRVSNGAITVDGANSSEWTTNMLIAIDKAGDDPRTLGSNWTTHEAPVDYSHLWAAWDDNNLYIAWQLVDITDVIDGANAGSGDVVSGNDGIIQWIAIDTIVGQGATLDMWDKNNGDPLWTGEDKPDFQISIASSLWQGYISEAVDGVFPVDDGMVHYFSTTAAGIAMANGNSLVPAALWGVRDCDNRAGASEEFRGAGHTMFNRDSFYEMSIPLSHLGLTATQLENNGIGLMIGMAMDTVPHDEQTVNTHGVEVWNSSLEWGDSDSLTSPFARVGSGK